MALLVGLTFGLSLGGCMTSYARMELGTTARHVVTGKLPLSCQTSLNLKEDGSELVLGGSALSSLGGGR